MSGPLQRVRSIKELGYELEQGMKIQAYRCTWDGDTREWMQYHDHTDPLPDEWDDDPPDEVAALVLKIDADIEIERLREALTALLACPSGMYCDAYPEAEKQARALLVPNA